MSQRGVIQNTAVNAERPYGKSKRLNTYERNGRSVEILGSENRIKPNLFYGKSDRVIYFHYHPKKPA